jgi:hypothetical protein
MSSSDESISPKLNVVSESVATEAATEAAIETTPELTEVNPTPSDESVTMKVSESEEKDTEETKVDPHLALMQMPITDQNSALNCIIGFIGIAQRRGVFALDEAAKAFECIKQFHNAN